MSLPFHVLIIGGGIGGLTLAQGLRRARISAAVYERDRTLTNRLQGYRVHISPTGGLALHECLPPHLFAVFDRTCGAPTMAVRFFTEQMRLLLAFDGDLIASTDPVARHRSASRITLRQVLLTELDNVHFGKTFQRYKQEGGRITAYFEDGASAEGDVLVAADGGGSRVRRQFLPDAQRVETGVVGIAGKIFLDTARDRIAGPLLDGISLVASRGGLGLFVAIQEIAGGPVGSIGGNEPVLAGTGNLYENARSYLMWALSAKREKFGLADVEQADSAALVATATRTMAGTRFSRVGRDRRSDHDLVPADPHLGSACALADEPNYPPRRRHPFDDTLSGHRRERGDQGRCAPHTCAGLGALRQARSRRSNQRLRNRHAGLRLSCRA